LDGHGGEKCGDTRDHDGHTKPNEPSMWLQSFSVHVRAMSINLNSGNLIERG